MELLKSDPSPAPTSKNRQSPERSLETCLETIAELALRLGMTEDHLLGVLSQKLEQLKENDAVPKGPQYPNELVSALYFINDAWFRLPDFTDDFGDPIPLPIHGPHPSVETLVEQAKRENPSAEFPVDADLFIKIVLERNNLEEVEGGRYRALSRSFTLGDKKAGLLMQYMSDFAGASRNNLHSTSDLGFQRCSYNYDFPTSALPRIKQFLLTTGMSFLEDADGEVCDNHPVTDPEQQTTRVSVGLYWHFDDDQ